MFREGTRACQLRYRVDADSLFRARRAEVDGFIGHRAVAVSIRRARGTDWRVNGEACPQLSGCLDIDLGFTPATNQFAIRRLALQVGERAEAHAVYVASPSMRVGRLLQVYRRASATTYAYESPRHGYQGELVVTKSGAIVAYPGLFESEGLR